MRLNTLTSNRAQTLESQKGKFLSDTSSFIKKQIAQIISSELKAHTLRTKLEKELEIHNKEQQQLKIKKSYYEDRVKNIPIKQKNLQKKKYEQFMKTQKERGQKLKYFKIQKHGNHQNKFDCINKSIQTVKHKGQVLLNDDIKHRLARITPQSSYGCRNNSLSKSMEYSRAVSTSNHSRCHLVKQFQEERETQRVSNYLKKIMKSQNNLLQKDLSQHNKKKNNPLYGKLICFVDVRKKKEEELMSRVDKEYNDRMHTFCLNRSHILENKEEKLISKIMTEKQCQKSVLIRKEQHYTATIQGFAKNFRIRQQKQNQIILKKRQLQAQNSMKLYHRKSLEMKQQRTKMLLDNKLKYLSAKFEKLRQIGWNEKTDEKTLKTILEMMDKNDPEYHNLVQFLKTERKVFMENIIKKEEERNKMDKTKKMNKTNNNHNN